jgi:hypothetical protein
MRLHVIDVSSTRTAMVAAARASRGVTTGQLTPCDTGLAHLGVTTGQLTDRDTGRRGAHATEADVDWLEVR